MQTSRTTATPRVRRRTLTTSCLMALTAGLIAITSPGNARAEQPEIMVVTSDPQYPWTPATDRGEHSDNADVGLSEALIREQYESINAFRRQYPGQHIPVIVNGDITSQSKRSEQQKISELFGILGNEVYYGLGNHDYENNLTNKVCKLLYCAMEALDNLAFHVQGHRNEGRILDFDYGARTASNGGIRKEGSWSYSFVPDGWKRVVNVQLNNAPHYEASIDWGLGAYSYEYRIQPSIPWIEQKLPEYSNPSISDFVLVHMHKPDSVSESLYDGQLNGLQALLKKNRVAAVFAGHYHGSLGRFDDRVEGGIPVFLSGSASKRTYLIVEHWPESKKLKVYGVRNNEPAAKELISDIPL